MHVAPIEPSTAKAKEFLAWDEHRMLIGKD